MPEDIYEPKNFAIDHTIMAPVDHFKFLADHLVAYKNDYVNREIRAGALGAKYVRGLPKSKALGAKNQYINYVAEVEGFADHIKLIRQIMFEVWQKLTDEEKKQFSEFENDLADKGV